MWRGNFQLASRGDIVCGLPHNAVSVGVRVELQYDGIAELPAVSSRPVLCGVEMRGLSSRLLLLAGRQWMLCVSGRQIHQQRRCVMLAVLSGHVFGGRNMHQLSCGLILRFGVIVVRSVSCGDVFELWMGRMQSVSDWHVLRFTRRDVVVILLIVSNKQLREWVSGMSTDGHAR